MSTLAPYIDAIPLVATTAERGTKFPSPDTNQRVQNLETGTIERYTGTAWVSMASANGLFNVKSYGATGDGATDDTVAIQAALTAAAVAGGRVDVPPGTYNHTTLTAGADTEVVLARGATLNHTTAAENAIVLGARSTLRGGTIESPETWDGTNAEATYAVVYTTADDVTVEDVRFVNIPRVGILFKNADYGVVRGCRLIGNYPTGQYTGTETGHIGISLDPGGGVTDGLITITGNIITTCVQGTFVGNYGTGAGQGVTFTGNTVNGCWDHGIYCATGDGYTITGNSFAECKIPVVVTGSGHVVSGNSMVTVDTGDHNDLVGISVRDGEGCVVVGNTLIGDAPASGTIIDVREFNGTTLVNNIVAHNTIVVSGGSSYAIKVGNGSATTMYGNIIQGNVVRSVGRASGGVIAVVGNSGTQGYGNSILDNHVVMLGDSNGIYVSQTLDTVVRGNHVRLEFDAGSAKTLGGVFLTGAATRTRIQDNTFTVTAAWGTNVTFRAVYENSGVSVASSIIRHNSFSLDPTKLTSGVTHVLNGTTPIVDEDVFSGSATYNAGSLADGEGVTTTVTVTGAALGDYAEASFSLDLQGITMTAWVSAANTVSVRLQNETTGAIDLASGTLKARVTRI